ncbi:hypothetical protein CEXT_736591 [Caerostris extrusa]|uniref:Uncharacterized protein n=1 Tax=Caerostris extrusa TaxID=172846 RepID=A0AAV4V186_CAEEX|nr:hypothetical protein CEXT_736591 [Caerostris extrusa]
MDSIIENKLTFIRIDQVFNRPARRHTITDERFCDRNPSPPQTENPARTPCTSAGRANSVLRPHPGV